MSKHIINAGATSQRFYIYLQDSTTGQGEVSVTSATCYYLRDSVSGTMPAAVTLTFGAVFASPGTYPAWTSGAVREIGYMPGLYLIDIPDAVFAVGARNAVVQIVPTTGTPWLPVNLEFTLSAVSLFDSVRMGMTALPNATAGAIGGLPLSVNAAGGVNTVQLGGTAQTGRDIGASVLLSSGTGVGQVNLSTGRIGINWADVINPTTTLALTGTTISTSQQVASVSGSVNSVATRVTANTDQWNGTGVTGMPMPTYIQPTGFLSASFPTTVASPTNITSGTITTVSGNVNGSVSSVTNAVTVGTINANVITATSIATGAIDADAIADSAITIRMSGDGTPSEGRIIAGSIANDVWNALSASYTTANTFGKLMDTLKKANFAVEGVTTAGSTTTTVNTGLTGYVTNAFADQTVLFISGALMGTSALIASSSAGGGTLTLDSALPGTPASGVDFVILATHVYTTQQIANATWQTDISGITLSGQAGRYVTDIKVDTANIGSSLATIEGTAYKESVADTLLGRNLAGGSNTGRLVKEALYALRNKSEIVGSTLNVYNATDGAIAWTATVASSASADPVTGIDPA